MIGFFADDLTGASDVLAQAHQYGLDAALVLDPSGGLPSAADVVGVAGTARSLSGAALDASVRAGLAPLADVDGLEVLLYKVCSTFDSSPTVGSIGRGIELLHTFFPDHGPVPVAPAQPGFGRWTAFSNHFGRSGDAAYRLDRHPVMSRHPSTPMHESDLRRVLAVQLAGAPSPDAVQLPAFVDDSFAAGWERARGGDGPAFVVDAVTEDHLDRIAEALLADVARPSLVVGSGGIMGALARVRGRSVPARPSGTGSSGPTLVVSASASSVTAGQIEDALEHGWTGVRIPVTPADEEPSTSGASGLEWSRDPGRGGRTDDLADEVTRALRSGADVVAYTTRGPDDPAFRGGGADPGVTGARIGHLAAAMVRDGLTADVVVCGGDTAGHALTAAGVRELRVAEQFVPIAPICHGDSVFTGCRLVLKGGQVGPPDMFDRFARGERT